MAKLVECAEHGRTEGCMICQHLRDGSGLGFYRVQMPPDSDDYETGLCEQCDELLWQEDGWTDRLFDLAEWRLYCRRRFQGVLARHRLLGMGRLSSGEDQDA